jgi:hypothetical protein
VTAGSCPYPDLVEVLHREILRRGRDVGHHEAPAWRQPVTQVGENPVRTPGPERGPWLGTARVPRPTIPESTELRGTLSSCSKSCPGGVLCRRVGCGRRARWTSAMSSTSPSQGGPVPRQGWWQQPGCPRGLESGRAYRPWWTGPSPGRFTPMVRPPVQLQGLLPAAHRRHSGRPNGGVPHPPAGSATTCWLGAVADLQVAGPSLFRCAHRPYRAMNTDRDGRTAPHVAGMHSPVTKAVTPTALATRESVPLRTICRIPARPCIQRVTDCRNEIAPDAR